MSKTTSVGWTRVCMLLCGWAVSIGLFGSSGALADTPPETPPAACSASHGKPPPAAPRCRHRPPLCHWPPPPINVAVSMAPPAPTRAHDSEVPTAAQAASAAATAASAAAQAASAAALAASAAHGMLTSTRWQVGAWPMWVASVLAAGAVIAGLFAAHLSNTEDGIRFQRHWGGFGGSNGGWQMSAGLAHLLVSALLAVASVLIIAQAGAAPANPSAEAGKTPAKR